MSLGLFRMATNKLNTNTPVAKYARMLFCE